jgi:predicted nucleic acid-binding protein
MSGGGAADVYGRVRAALERGGRTVAEPDLRIASICIDVGATLATGNLRHFRGLPGLIVEDWLDGARG